MHRTMIPTGQVLKRLVSPFVIMLALAGCEVNQQREVAHYRRILDEGNSLPPPVQRLDEKQTLSLQQAMALANQNDEDLALRGEDYVQALINKNRLVANFL